MDWSGLIYDTANAFIRIVDTALIPGDLITASLLFASVLGATLAGIACARLRVLLHRADHNSPPGVEAISVGAHRAAEVIRSVRAIFSRREQSEVTVVLDNLVRDTLALIGGELQSAHIAVETDLALGQTIVGDPSQLQ